MSVSRSLGEETYFVNVDERVYNFFFRALKEISDEDGILLHFSDLSTYAQVVCGQRFLVDELIQKNALDPLSVPHWWKKLKERYLTGKRR